MTDTAFEIDHPRALAGQFTWKTQGAPEVLLGGESAELMQARAEVSAAREEVRIANQKLAEKTFAALPFILNKSWPDARAIYLALDWDKNNYVVAMARDHAGKEMWRRTQPGAASTAVEANRYLADLGEAPGDRYPHADTLVGQMVIVHV